MGILENVSVKNDRVQFHFEFVSEVNVAVTDLFLQ